MNADIDPKTTIEAPQNLPPELKLLYDCISAKLDVLDKKNRYKKHSGTCGNN